MAMTVKYADILPVVQQLQATRGEVFPVVLGARGSLPRATVTALKSLGMAERKTLLDLSLAMLRTSIDIGRAHLDYKDRDREVWLSRLTRDEERRKEQAGRKRVVERIDERKKLRRNKRRHEREKVEDKN
ncbi:hypothetical protein J6590_091121 [Homalodisca vitripennis]|nr:hypothetical protein J6590_091121 [Homalodisca vitripennis]